MLRSVDLSDYMLPDPVKVSPDDDVFTAIKLIIQNRISGVCVVADDDKLVGVLSELDCLKAILSATYNESTSVGKVGEYMSSELDVCDLNADVVNVAAGMLKKGHRRLPVVKDGKMIGQITCRQLLRVVSDFNHA
jgi:CBS domain-containing protein